MKAVLHCTSSRDFITSAIWIHAGGVVTRECCDRALPVCLCRLAPVAVDDFVEATVTFPVKRTYEPQTWGCPGFEGVDLVGRAEIEINGVKSSLLRDVSEQLFDGLDLELE